MTERLVFGKLQELNVLQNGNNMINYFSNYSVKYVHSNNVSVSC